MTVLELQAFSGPVRVRMRDGAEFSGTLRTELLSERSLSVHLVGGAGSGVTLYIDQIAAVDRTEGTNHDAG